MSCGKGNIKRNSAMNALTPTLHCQNPNGVDCGSEG